MIRKCQGVLVPLALHHPPPLLVVFQEFLISLWTKMLLSRFASFRHMWSNFNID